MERSFPERGETQRRLDVDLVIDARSGDRDAFDRLMAGRAERAFRTAMAILGHEADARDATQEVFVKAWRQLRGLRDPGGVRCLARAHPGQHVSNVASWASAVAGPRGDRVFRRRHVELPAHRSAERFEDRTAELDELERAFEQARARRTSPAGAPPPRPSTAGGDRGDARDPRMARPSRDFMRPAERSDTPSR